MYHVLCYLIYEHLFTIKPCSVLCEIVQVWGGKLKTEIIKVIYFYFKAM